MVFRKITDPYLRYQVVDADGCLRGIVVREVFTSYVRGKRVKRDFWTARTTSYMPVTGAFKTRNEAAENLMNANKRRSPLSKPAKG